MHHLLALWLLVGGDQSGFTSFSDHRPGIVLEGNWESCRESDGTYGERVYDDRLGGLEVHLGPYHDFALFRGIQDDHRDHTLAANLLQPSTVDVVNGFGTQHWTAGGLSIDVVVAGGSLETCESWVVTVKRALATR